MENNRAAVNARFEKAKALIASGVPRYKATAQAGMGEQTFRKCLGEIPSKKKSKTQEVKSPKPKKHKFVDLHLSPQIENASEVTIIRCKTSQLADILKGLS